MSAERNKATVRRFWECVWNEGELSIFDEIVSADFRGHGPGPLLLTRSQFRDALHLIHSLQEAKDTTVHYKVEMTIAEGSGVAILLSVKNDEQSKWMRMLEDVSREVDLHSTMFNAATPLYFTVFYLLEDEQIVEQWLPTDSAPPSLMRSNKPTL